jgi:hypothetical protein
MLVLAMVVKLSPLGNSLKKLVMSLSTPVYNTKLAPLNPKKVF